MRELDRQRLRLRDARLALAKFNHGGLCIFERKAGVHGDTLGTRTIQSVYLLKNYSLQRKDEEAER